MPYIFEDPDWRGYFWSVLPSASKKLEDHQDRQVIDFLRNVCFVLLADYFLHP